MNKYFENEVCDRLCEAAILAGNNGVTITVDGLGFIVSRPVIKRPNAKKDFVERVGFLDISEAKFNVLLPVVEKALKKFKGEP
jgi:hypothetical protein